MTFIHKFSLYFTTKRAGSVTQQNGIFLRFHHVLALTLTILAKLQVDTEFSTNPTCTKNLTVKGAEHLKLSSGSSEWVIQDGIIHEGVIQWVIQRGSFRKGHSRGSLDGNFCCGSDVSEVKQVVT